MSKEIEAVAKSIKLQVASDNITQSQADKLVATLVSAWNVRNVAFDSDAFETMALGNG